MSQFDDLMEPRANLAEDAERLVAIAELVLDGIPIERFELGEHEIFVVIGYTQRALELEQAVFGSNCELCEREEPCACAGGPCQCSCGRCTFDGPLPGDGRE